MLTIIPHTAYMSISIILSHKGISLVEQIAVGVHVSVGLCIIITSAITLVLLIVCGFMYRRRTSGECKPDLPKSPDEDGQNIYTLKDVTNFKFTSSPPSPPAHSMQKPTFESSNDLCKYLYTIAETNHVLLVILKEIFSAAQVHMPHSHSAQSSAQVHRPCSP